MSTFNTDKLLKLLDAKLDEKFEQKLTPLSDRIAQMKEKVEEAMKHI